MTAILSTRDALEKALLADILGDGCEHRLLGTCAACLAARLLASGAVIDAATLADDWGLVDRLVRAWAGESWDHRRPAVRRGDITRARGWLRALAAALSERAS